LPTSALSPPAFAGAGLGELGAQPVEDGTALLGVAPRLGENAMDARRFAT
jgi:hypothetical protein